MTAPPDAEQIRDVNVRYHDAAADDYDFKWGISFAEVGEGQVHGKLTKALGHPPGRYARSLEIGAGTGYFTLNLLRAGVVERATASDISPGMLATLAGNARQLGLDVETQVADAEQLPFADASFDLVLGHAVLHHIPDLPRAFAEFHRVLVPGGTVVFAGEPSRAGDRIAAVPKSAAHHLAPLWRRAMRAAELDGNAGRAHHHGDDERALEAVVDVHAFDPATLREAALAAGFQDVRVRGEELLANWFGWFNRTLEATAEPASIPWAWRQYAFRGYLLLAALDRRVFEPHLPPSIFYNLLVSARRGPSAAPGERD